MTVSVLLLFLEVPCIGLQCVIVIVPGHNHLLLFKVEIRKGMLKLMFFNFLSALNNNDYIISTSL